MQVFTAAPHHNVLSLLIQIAVLLFSARAMGELAQRFRQPSVVGEILAGILLGPSLLGRMFPFVTGWIIPDSQLQGYLLETVSMIGAVFLLLLTGLETDVGLIRRHARTALGVSAGGITVTFVTGYLLGRHLPEYLIGPTHERQVFSLFIATAMSISAIPVIAKVLLDMKLMRRDIGQTIIASGMIDDTVGWVLLSIVAELASGVAVTPVNAAASIAKVLCFMALSFTLGRHFVKIALDFIQDEAVSRDRLLTFAMVATFLWASISQSLHLEPVLGAFVMGIILGQMPRIPHEVIEKIESMALGIFAPIFFAVAGLKVNLISLLRPELLVIAGAVIGVATFGKITGTFLGAKLIGRCRNWTALSFGAALNARGAMEIIIATIGLSLGILSPEMFSIIVVMAMTTSLMAPTGLRWVLAHIRPEEEEERRLRHEEITEGSPIAAIHRVLLPVRQRDFSDEPSAIQRMKIKILEGISKKNRLSITLISVSPAGEKDKGAKFLEKLGKGFRKQEILYKAVESDSTRQVILDEALKSYHLLMLGATEQRTGEHTLFSPLIDDLVRMSPCPTLVVHSRQLSPEWEPRKILVPTNGSIAAKRAAELAFTIAGSGPVEIIFLHVVVQTPWQEEVHREMADRQKKTGQEFLRELVELGRFYRVPVEAELRTGLDAEQEILSLAITRGVDLIILATDSRPASERLFLGPRVERILQSAPCPIAVLNIV